MSLEVNIGMDISQEEGVKYLESTRNRKYCSLHDML